MPHPSEQAKLLADWLYIPATADELERMATHLHRLNGVVARVDESRRLARPENLGEVYKIMGRPT